MTWAGSAASLRPSFCKWERGIMASGWWNRVSKGLQKLRHILSTTVFVQGRKAEGRVCVIRLWQGGVTDLMLLFLGVRRVWPQIQRPWRGAWDWGQWTETAWSTERLVALPCMYFTFTKIWG